MKYRKKPVIIDAVQFNGDMNLEEMEKFITIDFSVIFDPATEKLMLIIPTLEGEHLAQHGDYIIRGIAGEYYPCKPDIFNKTYEKV
jgi:hypothetical protein